MGTRAGTDGQYDTPPTWRALALVALGLTVALVGMVALAPYGGDSPVSLGPENDASTYDAASQGRVQTAAKSPLYEPAAWTPVVAGCFLGLAAYRVLVRTAMASADGGAMPQAVTPAGEPGPTADAVAAIDA